MRPLQIVLALSVALAFSTIASNLVFAKPYLQANTSHASQAKSSAQTAIGLWKGIVTLPSKKELAVEIQLQFVNSQWQGSISIPQQGAKDLPLQDIRIADQQAQFTITGVKGSPTFIGDFDADKKSLSGEFSQGSAKMPFRLMKEENPLKEEYPPTPSPTSSVPAPSTLAETSQSKPVKQQAAESAATNSKSLSFALNNFDQEVEKIRSDWKVPGLAIAIVKGDQVIYAKGYGLRDVKNNLPMTADTLMPIGSATKSFTTALMASLVAEGKLAWDKPVRQWIPQFKLQDTTASERMTPLDLVTHRSGMPRHDALWFNSKFSRAEMVSRLQYLEANKDFRTDFQYNNLMFLTAGYLTEVVSGQSWEYNVKQRLLLPLGMQRTNFSVEQTQKDGNYSKPHREESNGTVKQIAFRSLNNIGPAGSINTSVNELSAWMQLHLGKGKYQGKQVLSAADIDYLHISRMHMGTAQSKPELIDIGYTPGWFSDVYRGQLRLHHGGNIDGFSAMVMLLPQADIGIAILSNLESTPVRDVITRNVIDRLLHLERRDWHAEALQKKNFKKADTLLASEKKKVARKSDTKPSHALSEYVGEYEHLGYGIVSITQKDGSLHFELNGINAPLSHWHYDIFNGMKTDDKIFDDQKIQFQINLDGDIASLKTSLESTVSDIVFIKKPDSLLNDPMLLKKLTGTFVFNKNSEFTISLRGNTLFADMLGRPSYELIPVRGYRFSLKGLNGFGIEFKPGQDGQFQQAEISRPDSVSLALRK